VLESHVFLNFRPKGESSKTRNKWREYCHDLGARDYKRGNRLVNGFIDRLYTPLGAAIYRPLTHTQTTFLSLLQSPLAASWQRLLPRVILQHPSLRSSCHSRPCRSLVNWQLIWVPDWRPFHTNLPLFSIQPFN
jgi:hypothetical protein